MLTEIERLPWHVLKNRGDGRPTVVATHTNHIDAINQALDLNTMAQYGSGYSYAAVRCASRPGNCTCR